MFAWYTDPWNAIETKKRFCPHTCGEISECHAYRREGVLRGAMNPALNRRLPSVLALLSTGRCHRLTADKECAKGYQWVQQHCVARPNRDGQKCWLVRVHRVVHKGPSIYCCPYPPPPETKWRSALGGYVPPLKNSCLLKNPKLGNYVALAPPGPQRSIIQHSEFGSGPRQKQMKER